MGTDSLIIAINRLRDQLDNLEEIAELDVPGILPIVGSDPDRFFARYDAAYDRWIDDHKTMIACLRGTLHIAEIELRARTCPPELRYPAPFDGPQSAEAM